MTWTNAEPDTLMARVLAPANLRRAYQRVVSNKGAPGADGMTVDQLADYVKQYWPNLKTRLLAGEYHPQSVRAVEIPKPKDPKIKSSPQSPKNKDPTSKSL